MVFFISFPSSAWVPYGQLPKRWPGSAGKVKDDQDHLSQVPRRPPSSQTFRQNRPVQGQAHQEIRHQDHDIRKSGEEQPAEKIDPGHDLDMARHSGGNGIIRHQDDPQKSDEAVEQKP